MPPLILGHRGAPRELPENTLAGFRRALQQGADGVEFDVRVAADGEVVVIHDADLERTSGTPGIVSERTAGQLAALELGMGEGVPTLAAVASWAATCGAWLNVELKAAGADVVDAAVACLAAARVLERTILSSFLPESVAAAGKVAPPIVAYLLAEEWSSEVQHTVAAVGATGICLAEAAATPPALAELAARSLPTIVWTVDRESRMRELLAADVAGVITNLPGRGATVRAALFS